ncbi:sensor histidine kinase [Streptomyces sp. B93]|uniref:sensor histidine kinase n=1 Tax=Streptomyces sp. B93 TaxID=2824875 RepID=UPI001B392B4B|nr:sensor histidine kinase [Streptomyces sp. B93]MBQ1088252.1 sensor histidine kinase [Streptomyces sp. B93]
MNRTVPHAETPDRGVPGRRRGPFTRWPTGADAVLATVMFLLVAFLEEGPGDTMVLRSRSDLLHPALLLFVAGAAALFWRRRRPVVALGVTIAAWLPTLGSSYSTMGGLVIITLYSVGRYADDARWGPPGIAAAAAALVGEGVFHATPWGDVGFGVVVMAVAWYLGRRLRLRAERADRLRREQAAEARRIVTEERTHIARELHDVVAHRVSMMTVQAGAARMVAAEDPRGALEAMAAVEEAGRQALDELRHLLGVLRPDAERDGLGPQPGLADLPRLVAQVREAGLEVTVTGAVREPLPARVDLSAYRIVQEALTNVLKHSGPGTRTEVRLSGEGDAFTIEVLDDGGGDAERAVADAHEGLPGHGIVGMRERALLLGGTLEARPRPGGGFRLAARLPAKGESA